MGARTRFARCEAFVVNARPHACNLPRLLRRNYIIAKWHLIRYPSPMATCSIDGCVNRAKAHRLCAKHYMRLRRNGDATTIVKRGRPRDANRGAVRQMLSEMSARTYARWWRATTLIQNVGGDSQQAIRDCSRPNGTMNVAKLERLADRMMFDHVRSAN